MTAKPAATPPSRVVVALVRNKWPPALFKISFPLSLYIKKKGF